MSTEPKKVLTEADSLADLHGMPRPVVNQQLTAAQPAEQQPDCWRITHPSFCGIVTDKKEIAEDPFYSGCVFPLYAKPVPADKPVTRQDVIDVLLSTRGQSEGVTADAILGLLSDKGAATVPDAIQLLQRVSASTTDKPAVAVPDGALAMLNQIIAELEGGFVSCQRCGDQEETANLDCMYDLKKLRNLLASAPSHSQQVADIDGFVSYLRERYRMDVSEQRDEYLNLYDRCPSHESEQGGKHV